MFKRAVIREESVRPVGNINHSNIYWVTMPSTVPTMSHISSHLMATTIQ